MGVDVLRRAAGERLPIDRKSASGIDLRSERARIEPASQQRKLIFQHACRAFGLHALERIRAYELGAPGSRVHRSAYRRAHLEEPNAHASVGKLERRFGSRKAGAYDVYRLHAAEDTIRSPPVCPCPHLAPKRPSG